MSVVVKHAEEFAAHNSFGLRHGDHLVGGGAPSSRPVRPGGQSCSNNPSKCIPATRRRLAPRRSIFSDCSWRWRNGDRASKTRPGDGLPKHKQPSTRSSNLRRHLLEFRIPMEVLRREAEELIEPKEADEAVEKESGTSDESKHLTTDTRTLTPDT